MTTFRTWIEIATPITVVLVALWRWEKRVSSRLDEAERARRELGDMLKRNFGPNSGGLREAVNSIQSDVVELKAGQREQHVRMDEHIRFHLEGK